LSSLGQRLREKKMKYLSFILCCSEIKVLNTLRISASHLEIVESFKLNLMQLLVDVQDRVQQQIVCNCLVLLFSSFFISEIPPEHAAITPPSTSQPERNPPSAINITLRPATRPVKAISQQSHSRPRAVDTSQRRPLTSPHCDDHHHRKEKHTISTIFLLCAIDI
jgi:hypothetical protein